MGETQPYYLQNDPAEYDRLNRQAAGLANILNGEIFQAPLSNPTTVLDIGCGSGIVTRELGRRFPLAKVYGLDLSPVPEAQQKPENVHWVQGNVREMALRDSRFGSGSIDYVFHRLLLCGMRDWQGYVNQVATMLKPGGWAELQDVNYVWYDGNGDKMFQNRGWVGAMTSISSELGLDIECGSHMADYMREAGLVDISVKEYRWPFGKTPGAVDLGTQANIVGVIRGLLPRLLAERGYESETISGMEAECTADLAPEAGKHWKLFVTVGRKP